MNKKAYFNILKQLHDICRDNPKPSLTGMDAYNEIINYLYLRHLSDNSEKDLLRKLYNDYCTDDKIKLDEENYAFNVSTYSGMRRDLLFDTLSKKLLPNINNPNKNKKIYFVKIMGDELNDLALSLGRLTNLVNSDHNNGGQKAQVIINKLYQKNFLPLDENGKFNINLFPYDAVGEGFEKFMRDAGSIGGNWGQYFTNPQVINWIIDKIEIKQNDIITDPFAGSGGFILKVAKKVNNTDNIYAHEIDDKIFKFLKFNSKIANINSDNIKKGDSFDFESYLENEQECYDKILTNPPFGLKISNLLHNNPCREKFWHPLKSGKYSVKDSMGLALLAILKMLKNGGITGVVCERGVLNNGVTKNSWQVKLRKYLLENSDLSDILLLPKGIFSHTNFDTACLIFTKGKKTKKVNYHLGYFKDDDKGKENKTMYIQENYKQVKIDDIYDNNWSLNINDYVKEEEILIKGIEYKTIEEICEIKRVKCEKDNVCVKNGKYPYYNSSILNHKWTDIYSDDDEVLIINKVNGSGKCKIFYNNGKYSCSSATIIFKSNNDKINNKYLLIVLTILKNNIQKLYSGGDKKSLKLSSFQKLKIPILSSKKQKKLVKEIDKIFNDYGKLNNIVDKYENMDLLDCVINEDYELIKKLLNIEERYNELKNNIYKIEKDEIEKYEKYLNKLVTS
jgi:type I restriction-modification system DNA methylase subunit